MAGDGCEMTVGAECDLCRWLLATDSGGGRLVAAGGGGRWFEMPDFGLRWRVVAGGTCGWLLPPNSGDQRLRLSGSAASGASGDRVGRGLRAMWPWGICWPVAPRAPRGAMPKGSEVYRGHTPQSETPALVMLVIAQSTRRAGRSQSHLFA